MSTVQIFVAGIGYTNNPAGTGGTEYQASISGSERDSVWYQVDRNIIREAVFGEDIRQAFLDASSRSQLDDMSVTYKTRSEVEACGMGNYVLWLKADK